MADKIRLVEGIPVKFKDNGDGTYSVTTLANALGNPMTDIIRTIEGIPLKFIANGDGSYSLSILDSAGGGGNVSGLVLGNTTGTAWEGVKGQGTFNNVSILQGNVTNLTSNVSTLQGNVTNLTSNVSTLQGNVTNLTIVSDAAYNHSQITAADPHGSVTAKRLNDVVIAQSPVRVSPNASDVLPIYKYDGSGYFQAYLSTLAEWIGNFLKHVGSIQPFAAAVGSGYLACDGTASGNRTTHADLYKYLVTDAGFTSQAFTVTIANPAVFSKPGHGFTGGERGRLSTTGALPTGLVTTIDYYVIYVSANTFQVSTTFGGTAVATSGTQSGIHSYMQSLYGLGDGSTTFNVPDFRDEFLRGLSATGRTLGTRQAGMLQAHDHTTLINVNSLIQVTGGANAYSVNAIGTTPTGTTGGAETRPRNVAVNYGIKY